MQFDGALIKEQGQKFAIAVVNGSVGNGGDRALRETAASFAPVFSGVPIVLMWQDAFPFRPVPSAGFLYIRILRGSQLHSTLTLAVAPRREILALGVASGCPVRRVHR